MIEINLIKTRQKKSASKRRATVLLAAVAVSVSVSGFYLKFGGGAGAEISRTPIEKKVVRKQTSFSAAPKVFSPRKNDRQTKPAAFKVAGFVNFTDKKFAMVVKGRSARWVEEGDKVFGLRIASIKEGGVLAENVSGTGKTVFVPLRK